MRDWELRLRNSNQVLHSRVQRYVTLHFLVSIPSLMSTGSRGAEFYRTKHSFNVLPCKIQNLLALHKQNCQIISPRFQIGSCLHFSPQGKRWPRTQFWKYLACGICVEESESDARTGARIEGHNIVHSNWAPLHGPCVYLPRLVRHLDRCSWILLSLSVLTLINRL